MTGLGPPIAGLLDRPLDFGVFVASGVDLLRLVALPAFGYAAWKDVRTRRIANDFWRPLVLLGVALFAIEAYNASLAGGTAWSRFLLQAGLAVGFVVPLAYAFWRMGGFGGADVKAVMVVALLFPTYPEYLLQPPLTDLVPGAAELVELPVVATEIGVFSFTVLTNAVLVAAAYPVATTVRNALAGRFSSVMFVGHPVPVERLPTTYGRLLERPGGHTRRGLDLDALRMYLRWRGLSLSALRADPDRYRDPATLPETPNDPTDGNVIREGEDVVGAPAPGGEDPDDEGAVDGENAVDAHDAGADEDTAVDPDYDDPWGAEAFLDDVEGSAYGTRPGELRDGLEVLAERDGVWISPGLPFVVPLFLGLVLAVAVGDLLFGLFGVVGVV